MDDYYVNQAGSGLGGFAGHRYQKGDGFFGRMLSGTVLPILKKVLPYLGRNVLSAAGDIVSDVAKGEKFGQSVKTRFKSTASKIGDDAMTRIKQFTGSGRRKVRRKKAVKKTPKRKRSKKRSKRSGRKSIASDFL